ncbi:MAG: helix-turn-helix transcriptional regulator [Prosthecobacter sp.]|nr:helix-turn-helix transcriptional regulator [Prosthecobacter sp.]
MDSKSVVWHHCLVVNRDSNLVELGQRIRESRKAMGFSQEDLAHESGIDRSYIGGVERGERNITFTMLCKIATALKCDVANLTKQLPQKGK